MPLFFGHTSHGQSGLDDRISSGRLAGFRCLKCRMPPGIQQDLGVSKNRGGPPKSSILIVGFSIINHPFWCTPIFGNTHLMSMMSVEK